MRLSKKAQETAGMLTGQLSESVRLAAAKIAKDDGREFADEKDVKAAFRLELLVAVKEFLKSGVCAECGGGGEIGLSDGEVPCPACGGSGDPLQPGFWGRKSLGVDR